jgi:S1-C subfamily serine protease
LDHLPDQFVVDNLGFVLRIGADKGLDDETLRQFNKIYRRAVHDLDLSPGEATHFVYLSPFALDLKKDGGAEAGDTRERVQIGTGTGFVVAPNLVLTNWHVVDGCTEIMIVDPKNRDRQLVATVVASAENPDLALLECKGLEAPPISLADRLPLRGEDIMCLGFPGGSLLGLALKSTKGSVISQGDAGLNGGDFLHSCIINPGNSGGPIVDQTGSLVGVVVAIVKTSTIGNAYGIGIPIERVRKFLDAEIKKYEEARPGTRPTPKPEAPPEGQPSDGNAAEGSPDPTPPRSLSWAEVDAKVSPSTVFIVGKMRVGPE